MAASKVQIPLKVVIDKQNERVVFAEADGDFVDILFSFLTMPMGTVVRLLSKQSQPPAIGSFNNLYKSIANLESKYFVSEECKDMLLNTRNSSEFECRKLKINIDDTKPMDYFTCTSMGIDMRATCTHCYNYLNTKAGDGVFVRPTASFVLTDDLQIFPGIPASTLAILKSCGITDCGVLEEKTFNIRSTEILNLLKYSMLSKSPLTSLFLVKNCIAVDNLFQNIKFEKRLEIISFKKMTVKVFVQKSNKKILLAHSSEDFIDFLFNCLAVPLGRFNTLFSKDNSPVLGVKNIQQSVSGLNVADYLKSQQMKDILLLPQLDTTSVPLISPVGDGGFLKGSTKFMVTDDLVVTPFSLISCVNYIMTSNVPPTDIEEQVIEIGSEEARNLIRASLISTKVLTLGLKHLIQSKPCTKRAVKRPKLEE